MHATAHVCLCRKKSHLNITQEIPPAYNPSALPNNQPSRVIIPRHLACGA